MDGTVRHAAVGGGVHRLTGAKPIQRIEYKHTRFYKSIIKRVIVLKAPPGFNP